MKRLFWIVSILCGVQNVIGGGGSTCPVEQPCYCDRVQRGFRTKRIVCDWQSEAAFPDFVDTGEEIDHLMLMYNDLTTIPAKAFLKVNAVRIDLQGNSFENRINEKAFYGIERTIEALNFAWSNLESLPAKTFRGMFELRNLSLAENQLGFLPGSLFQDLRNLRKLSVSGNPIRFLSDNLFRYQTNLETLDLGYCEIIELPSRIFNGLWNLNALDLRGNHLREIRKGLFSELHSLETLMLGHNPVHSLGYNVFRGLHNLQWLEIKESTLRHLAPGAFKHTTNLIGLDLADNSIQNIDDGVLTLPKLEWLALDGNFLQRAPNDLRRLPNLQHLDLSYNRLVSLDPCLMDSFSHLTYLNIRRNRFHCDCHLFWLRNVKNILMQRWQSSFSIPIIPGHCVSPEALSGVGVTSWIDMDCLRDPYKYDNNRACDE